MKNKTSLIIFTFIILIGCKKDFIREFPKIELEKFGKNQLQTFDLDTLVSFEINGKNGTKIFYNRENFQVSKKEKVSLNLKEFYNFEDLIYNNINTITSDGKLLESSGVIFIEFKVGNQRIELKENKFLKIEFPENKLKGNNLFSAKVDTLGQFEWDILDERKAIIHKKDVLRNAGGGITVIENVVDTIGYYPGKYYKIDSIANSIMTNNLNWINIDKFVKNTSPLDFKINLNNVNIDVINSYVVYKNLNSFISNFHRKDSIHLNNIPFIKNNTFLIIVGFKNDYLFVDKIELNEQESYEVNLKKTTETELKEILKRN